MTYMEMDIHGGKRSKGWGGWVVVKQPNIECQDDTSLGTHINTKTETKSKPN